MSLDKHIITSFSGLTHEAGHLNDGKLFQKSAGLRTQENVLFSLTYTVYVTKKKNMNKAVKSQMRKTERGET